MSLVKFDNVSLSLGEKTIFSNLNFSINSGDRIGIIGDNGSGKSSLLRSIAKLLDEHEGDISHSRGLRCQYVEQGFSSGWDDSIALEILESCLHKTVSDKWKAEYVFELIGFPKDYRTLRFCQLSGGWKKMLMIARAVLLEPDLLLLDEPTNHLDKVHIEKLTSLLKDNSIAPTFAVVSHNRYFLDSVTSSTFILNNKMLAHFKASFTPSRKLFLANEKELLRARIETVNEIQRLKKSAQFQRQLGVNNYSDKALQKAKRIERKIKMLESIVPGKPVSKKNCVTLAVDELSARKILQIDDLSLCSPEGELLFFIKSLVVNRGDRLVISGANGCGKSTFLKAILNLCPQIRMGPSIKVGVVDQELSSLPLDLQILEFFAVNFELDRQQAINKLASSGFSYLESKKMIGHLSYGERARLLMLALRLKSPNFLILDEPTNHLDISSQEFLESEIQRLDPAAIIVSHDVRFIENVSTRFFEVSNGQLRELSSNQVH
ncbi:ATP-binding cassette domain-containing protein [Pseudomonas sp. G(2018)]|uniref:ATP-binding cassette domain-containing protein n=1 Tax=Pseudomonas sp. G(2018) TaxID=2502242 RepID=UPI0010F7F4AA|nr:ATP-binding cassette domain-containing protein [Pseudomonas sp. G(2018)]